MTPLIRDYVKLAKGNESPEIFYLWSLLSMAGQITSRNTYLPFGRFKLYGNLYIMLIGNSGVRKSFAIKESKRFIEEINTSIVCMADKVSAIETLMYSLSKQKGTSKDESLDPVEWFDCKLAKDGTVVSAGLPANGYIASDEIADFFGGEIVNYVKLLGVLWDIDRDYTYQTRHTGDVIIPNPHIGVLGGITPGMFNTIFPSDIAEQGFLSRLILVTSDRPEKRFSIPKVADDVSVSRIRESLAAIQSLKGAITISEEVYKIQDEIYNNWHMQMPLRLQAYPNRRHTQLLKLMMAVSATRMSTCPTMDDIVTANTILTYAELNMANAFGEFGKNKTSGTQDAIVQLLKAAKAPVNQKDIFNHVKNDAILSDVIGILRNLEALGIISSIPGKGFISMAQSDKSRSYSKLHVDWDLLEDISPEISSVVKSFK